MKLNMLKMAALMCCLMTFAACGDDKDEPEVQLNCTYTVTFGPDFLDVASVIIYYKSENNITKPEAITPAEVKNNTWTKSFTTRKVPADLGVKFVVFPKDVELTKDNYDLRVDANIAATLSSGGNYSNKKTISGYSGVSKDKVESIVRTVNNKDFGYKVDRNGNFSPASHNYEP